MALMADGEFSLGSAVQFLNLPASQGSSRESRMSTALHCSSQHLSGNSTALLVELGARYGKASAMMFGKRLANRSRAD
jgi:hypothetical protein